MAAHPHVDQALRILQALGLPRAQQNERSALCLLALLNLTPEKEWPQAENPLIGITPIMDWARRHYQRDYAPNTRETVRRQTMHQFVAAGLALYNPDDPLRPTNSPKAVYQIELQALALLKTYGTHEWEAHLASYLAAHQTLAARYARERDQQRIPVQVAPDEAIHLSVGEHSALIKSIIEDFASRFVPGATLIYVGDTGDKWGYFDREQFGVLGVAVGAHGKMPDVALYDSAHNWLVLVEAVTSHGPMDAKRHEELAQLFAGARAGLVFVTAFPDRATLARYLADIAWETEVWVADAPSHLIHFNGSRFLGPHEGA